MDLQTIQLALRTAQERGDAESVAIIQGVLDQAVANTPKEPSQKTPAVSPEMQALLDQKAEIDNRKIEPNRTMWGYGKEMTKAAAKGITETARSGIAGLVGTIAPETERTTVKPWLDWEKQIEEEYAPADPDYKDTMAVKAAGIAGGLAPYIPLGLAGAAGLAATTGAGEAVQRAQTAGATDEQVRKAGLLGGAIGTATVAIPGKAGSGITKYLEKGVEKAGEAALAITPNIASKMLLSEEAAARVAGAEAAAKTAGTASGNTMVVSPGITSADFAPGVQTALGQIKEAIAHGGLAAGVMTAQAAAQNLVAQKLYKPDQAIMEGTGQAGEEGAMVGAVVKLLMNYATHRGNVREAARQEEAARQAQQGPQPQPQQGPQPHQQAPQPQPQQGPQPHQQAPQPQPQQGPQPQQAPPAEPTAEKQAKISAALDQFEETGQQQAEQPGTPETAAAQQTQQAEQQQAALDAVKKEEFKPYPVNPAPPGFVNVFTADNLAATGLRVDRGWHRQLNNLTLPETNPARTDYDIVITKAEQIKNSIKSSQSLNEQIKQRAIKVINTKIKDLKTDKKNLPAVETQAKQQAAQAKQQTQQQPPATPITETPPAETAPTTGTTPPATPITKITPTTKTPPAEPANKLADIAPLYTPPVTPPAQGAKPEAKPVETPPAPETKPAAPAAAETKPAAPTETKPVLGYTTDLGSVYTLHEDGTTSRNKSPHPGVEHANDEGPKERSVRTVYFENEKDANSFGGAVSGEINPAIMEVERNGKRYLVRTAINKQAGVYGLDSSNNFKAETFEGVPFSETPTVGATPLELLSSVAADHPARKLVNPEQGILQVYGTRMHKGNKIAELHTDKVPEVAVAREPTEAGKPPFTETPPESPKAAPLIKAGVAGASPLSTETLDHLQNNRLSDALNQIGKDNAGPLGAVARMFARHVDGVHAAVHDFYGEDLPDHLTQLFADKPHLQDASGLFVTTPEGQRHVAINAGSGGDAWTVLHETTHAVVNRLLDNVSHPVTRQLDNLYKSVQPAIAPHYGATNLHEFVAEAQSNTNFRNHLAAIPLENGQVTAWQRYINIVSNVVRRMLNKPPIDVNRMPDPRSALDEVDRLVQKIVDVQTPTGPSEIPSPLSYAALFKHKEIMEYVGKKVESVPFVGPKFVNTISDLVLSDIPKFARKALYSSLPTTYLKDQIDHTLRKMPEVSDVQRQAMRGFFEKYETITKQQAHDHAKRMEALNATIKMVESAVASDPTKWQAMQDVVTRCNLSDVDPSKPRTAYTPNDVDWEGTPKQQVWDTVQPIWQSIGEAGRKGILQAREVYKKLIAESFQATIDRLEAMNLDPMVLTDLKTKFTKRLQDQLKQLEFYFPLTRGGDKWLMFTRAGNPNYVSFESARERRMYAEALRNDPAANVTNIIETGRPNSAQLRNQTSDAFLYDVLRTLEKNKVDERVQDAIVQSYISLAPQTHFAKSFTHRKRIAGAEQDFIKVLRTRGAVLSHQLSRLKYGADLQRMPKDMDDLVKSLNNREVLQDMQGVFNNLVNDALNPQNPTWAKALQTGAFTYTIGGNPSSPLMDLFHLPMVVWTHLSPTYGRGASKAILDGMRTVLNSGTTRAVEPYANQPGGANFINLKAFHSIENIDFAAKPDLAYLKPLVDLGSAHGQLHSRAIEFLNDYQGSPGLLDKVHHYMGAMLDYGDQVRRQASLVAIYNLELRKMGFADPKTAPDAALAQAAKKAVSLNEYLNGPAVAAMGSHFSHVPVGRLALMFKRYGIQMTYMQVKAARDALARGQPSDMTPAEWQAYQKTARKQLTRTMGMAAMFAGVKGMPMMWVASTLYNLLLGGDEADGTNEDFDTMMRRHVAEPVYSGLINALGIEAASRISLNQADLVGRWPQVRGEHDSAIWAGLEAFGGPVIGTATRWEDGLKLMNEGHIERGMEKLLPTAISNLLKGWRYGQEGGATSKRGDMITELTPLNALGQMLGLAPASLIKQSELNQREESRMQYARTMHSKLLQQYFVAFHAGDADEIDAVMEKIARFNQAYPQERITADMRHKSVQRQNKITNEMLHGIHIDPKWRAIIQDDLDSLQ